MRFGLLGPIPLIWRFGNRGNERLSIQPFRRVENSIERIVDAHVQAHPTGPLGKDLERMLSRKQHHREYSCYKLVRHALVKQITHRIDEDARAFSSAAARR